MRIQFKVDWRGEGVVVQDGGQSKAGTYSTPLLFPPRIAEGTSWEKYEACIPWVSLPSTATQAEEEKKTRTHGLDPGVLEGNIIGPVGEWALDWCDYRQWRRRGGRTATSRAVMRRFGLSASPAAQPGRTNAMRNLSRAWSIGDFLCAFSSFFCLALLLELQIMSAGAKLNQRPLTFG